MKLKRLFMLAIGSAFLLTNAGKPVVVANEIDKINENVTQQVMRLANYVSKNDFQICPIPVSFDFCVTWQTHFEGLSSYTWYQNTARNLILKAGTKLTTVSPEIDSFNSPEYFAMKHFHNCEYVNDVITRVKAQPMHRSHSFFGLLYYYPSSDSEPIVHPDSPTPNPNA